MEGKLKILVLEDKESHMADARGFFDSLEDAEVTYGGSFEERGVIRRDETGPSYDLVVSDVFMPGLSKEHIRGSEESEDKAVRGRLRRLERSLEGGDKPEFLEMDYEEIGKAMTSREAYKARAAEGPYGLTVAVEAQKAEIPVVLCSDSFHHSAKMEPIYAMTRALGVSLIDEEPASLDRREIYEKMTSPARVKDWKLAYEVGLREMEAK